MPDCTAIRQLVQSYLDDALDPPERARLEAHTAGCPGCRRLVATYRHLFAALDAPALPEAPATLTATVMRRIAAARAPAQSWPTWIAAAAMVFIAVGAALFAWGEPQFGDWSDLGAVSVSDVTSVPLDVVGGFAGSIVEGVSELELELPLWPHLPLLVVAVAVVLGANAALAYRWRGLAGTDRCPGARTMR